MGRAWPGHIAAIILLAGLLTAARTGGATAEGADEVRTLNDQVTKLLESGKYAEASMPAQQALDLSERTLGKENPETLVSLNNLAFLYFSQGRYPQAEPLFERVLKVREQKLGHEHPATLVSVNNLAMLYKARGRYDEAGQLYRHALETRERTPGSDNPDTLMSVNNLAALYFAMSRYEQAEPLFARAFQARERVLGKEHRDTLTSAGNLALLYQAQGRYSKAAPLLEHTLEAEERVLGKEHPLTLTSVNNLALLYQAQGRFAEAERLYKRVLEVYERVRGKEHPATLTSVSNLAALYRAGGRLDEAEPLLRRVLESRERVLGKEHPDTLQAAEGLAVLYRARGRYGEAEAFLKRVLEAKEHVLGKENPQTLTTVSNLARLYQEQDRHSEAQPLLARALEGRERAMGKEHPLTLSSANNLAGAYYAQGQFAQAEALFQRVLEARERVLGKEHPDTLASLDNLAGLYFEQAGWKRAVDFWRRSTAGIARRTQLGAAATGEVATEKTQDGAEQSNWQFKKLVKAAWRLTPAGAAPAAALTREMFETVQWAQSTAAAASLTQMAVRSAAGDPKLAALARERQDLVLEWQKRDHLYNTALGQPAAKRDSQAEAENLARLAAIDTRIAEIGSTLRDKFPDYAAFTSPAALPADEVQALLGADEALIFFLDTAQRKPVPGETFIWVVTKTDLRWVRSDLGGDALAREVQALRCGLDDTAWEDKPCAELTGQSYTGKDREAGKPLPFDHARAYELYRALFGQVEDLIQGKQLLIVPSGSLTQLPFQVLVTAPPAGSDLGKVAWLIREHALSVLPAVSSLKALRRVARPSAAAKPLIGFGNPLLDGRQDDPKYGAYFKKQAALARENQSCPRTPLQRLASLIGLRGVAPIATRGLADTALIKAQLPLPETRDELCTVARDVGADPGELRLGARATEREVKAMSAAGALAQYRIVHFATHGVLAGQLDAKSEPGLILTPPDVASEEDDGYLTASEIAGLKLDADWVILSACNTAAGGAAEAQALSGLARAFFYAQARALLVSHWEVNSDATVKLITGAVREIARDRRVGRAEALRRSMVAMIDAGGLEAHPAFWAPFVVVGEGGAGR